MKWFLIVLFLLGPLGRLAAQESPVERISAIEREVRVYVGTYTWRGSEGIYVYQLDLSTGVLESLGTAPKVENPSFLALAPDRRFLYAVNEVRQFGDQEGGAVSAFAIDPASGALSLLNQQSSKGGGPCHLSVDATGRYALVANYGGGSVAILPIGEDGRLGPATDFVQHEGSSVHPRRQKGPHTHSITLDPANRRAFAADLGLDKILGYEVDLENGQLTAGDPPWTEVAKGAGPRHFTFHPDGEFAYLINELTNSIVAYTYNEGNGALDEIQTISTLPDDFAGTSYCADVHVSPDGRFLYGSNRGHDSIAVFGIDPQTGRLTPIEHVSTGGETPRNFGIDPTGLYLLVANQKSAVFGIDPQTGRLVETGHRVKVPMPVCVMMVLR